MHLDLSGNDIGDAGAWSLARVLGQCKALTHLHLSGNKIGAGGAGRLAGVLAQCTALAHLNLRENIIDDDGEKALQDWWCSAQR